MGSSPDACWLGSEAWYEGNLRAMLRCVDLSRGLLETPGRTGDILMQLKITALASTQLCVREGQGGRGSVVAHQVPLTPHYHPIPEGANLMGQKARGFLGAEPQETG